MSKFFELYNSFDDFYETFSRGNEVEFSYNGEQYYVLPQFDDLGKVVGIYVGKQYSEEEVICTSRDDLYNVKISDSSLGTILEKIIITWNNC